MSFENFDPAESQNKMYKEFLKEYEVERMLVM